MKVSILGVEFHSENKGCGALAYSACIMLNQLAVRKGEKIQATAFVIQSEPAPVMQNMPNIKIRCIKYRLKSLRFWREAYQIMKGSDWIIDYSLGDSFSDLYGKSRFYKHSLLRICALLGGKPYVLGPQTFGPFEHRTPRMLAQYFIKKSRLCFARDQLSQEYAKSVSGRVPILTTDVAFVLSCGEGAAKKKDGVISVGINPSGLLWDGQHMIHSSKKMKIDYKKYIMCLLSELQENACYEIHLIPHVFSKDGTGMEDDGKVCRRLHEKFPNTVLAPLFDTPMDAKRYIADMDLFIGSRMHATIAAVSCGVATIPVSYSRKFEGLFSGLSYPYVISTVELDTEAALEKTKMWIKNWEQLKKCAEKTKILAEEKEDIFLKHIGQL